MKMLAKCLVFALFAVCGQSTFAQKHSDLFKAKSVSLQEEAGAVHVAILGVRNLNEIVDELQPKFTMTEQLALDSSIPITLSYYNEAISSFKLALKLAPPLSSAISTDKVSTTAGVTTSSSEVTKKEEPGDLSKVPKEEAAHPALRDGKIPEGGLGTDASSRYQVAKTLFQEIKLLNRSLKDLPAREGYESYVVTVQITLMPYRRDLPYDAYSSLAFFCGESSQGGTIPNTLWLNKNGQETQLESFKVAATSGALFDVLPSSPQPTRTAIEPNPIIFPLLTTDNLEASDNDRILNQIRQFNVALAAMFSGFGASLGADYFKQNLEAVNGRDLNGLLTVGRMSENSLHVRLGAMNQSRSEFATIPRTHCIALVVQAPTNSTNLRLVGRTTFRDARTGKELSLRRDEIIQERFRDLLRRYDSDAMACKVTADPFFLAVAQNNYEKFAAALAAIPEAKNKTTKLTNYTDALWMETARLCVGSQFSQTSAPLSGPPKPSLENPQQLIVLLDDADSGTTLTVKGGKKMSPSNLRAELHLHRTDGSIQMVADSLEISDAGATVRAKFPSLRKLDLLTPAEFTNYNANAKSRSSLELNLKLFAGATNWTITNLWLTTKKPTPESPVSPIAIGRVYGNLISGLQSTQWVSVVISTNATFVAGNFLLEAAGGLVVQAESRDGAINGSRVNGLYPLLKDGEVSFGLGTLSPFEDVKFYVHSKGKGRTVEQPLATIKVLPSAILGSMEKK